MFHLVYTSYASHPMLESDLLHILTNSRQNNRKNKITGMLVYLNEKFIQVLEGKYETVMNVYEKIMADKRHERISKMLEGNTKQRIFKDWSMGFKKLNEHEFRQLSGYQDPVDFFNTHPVTDGSPAVMIFLRLFYKKNMNDYPEVTT